MTRDPATECLTDLTPSFFPSNYHLAPHLTLLYRCPGSSFPRAVRLCAGRTFCACRVVAADRQLHPRLRIRPDRGLPDLSSRLKRMLVNCWLFTGDLISGRSLIMMVEKRVDQVCLALLPSNTLYSFTFHSGPVSLLFCRPTVCRE